ncbi:MAG: lipid-transfer protein [Gammaproteobacteria bacterium]|nr:lipid-transfer protein [Gammaproteobacteria bacterium]MDH3371918.1 lipid-transfer protein [Gammaproteobacteria bacterium]MDH3407753.1 lipid-transfer protein [Gammaproteobacteria bacterium]MDH3551128.1 lipid-transfer protein [Gammaproteobacteria bacterium]
MSNPVAILGVGMHPWGKWGRNFVEYGVKAARDALADAGVSWTDIDFVAGASTMRCGYPGYVSGATFAQALGWTGARIASCYAACASGSQALDTARAQILAGLADVALVVGADTTPKGFLAPQKGERPDDPDWLRFRLHGATNPVYFALHARRRLELYGTTDEDIAAVRVKNGQNGLHNPNARYRKAFTLEEVLESPIVSDPLRLYEICATSDGGAAIVVASTEYAKQLEKNPATIEAISTITPTFPSTQLELPDLATDSAASVPAPDMNFKPAIIEAAYQEAGIGPDDLSLAEVYDLSTSMELDWYEALGLCPEGDGHKLLRDGDTEIGGRIPVNASGGLSCFGEAVPAQALAQVCELVWQLRGEADKRQVRDARVGITANVGLFGHGSSVIVKR